MGAQRAQWQQRPGWSMVVRAVVVLLPITLAVLAGVVAAELLPRPSTWGWRLVWSASVLGVSTGALLAIGRVTRRLLPLALLLRAGLVFPDQAPTRFGVALRALRPRRATAGADGDDPADALALLARLLTHDRRTRGHSERVAAYGLVIADELGVDTATRAEVRWAGLLHDVGKIEVPLAILDKPGGLDDEEWEVMAGHPEAGRRLVEPLRPLLGDAVVAVSGHHERWDGTGYPAGRPSSDLPLSTRIVSVADAFETMTAARSYKEPMTMSAARAEVMSCAGGQFDPAVVRALLGVSVPRLWRVAGPLAWLAQVPFLGAILQGSLAPRSAFASGLTATAGQVVGGAALVGSAVAAGATLPPAEPVQTVPAAVVDATPGLDGASAGSGRPDDLEQAWAAVDRPPAGIDRPATPATSAPGAEAPPVDDGGAGPGPATTHDPIGAPPGHGGPPADPGGTPPGQDGGGPGPPVVPPGHGGVPPGQVDPPGQGGLPPGQGVPPGHGGVPPGQGDPPGQGGHGNPHGSGAAAG